jgi:DNA polymerase-3 subunit gamma/tau
VTTALYRRYRPQTFAEVIGQDHVTAPLRAALRGGQIGHAFLFSGPRGCGKTSSARILARVLNCARNTPEHPTDTPCGECESCLELGTGGPGSLDVVEIDAASHGGVDDARELRERATFAPARDRYKVFILDEAHMVSNQGFNALLKIVEEPPPHVKFVFATTEPDKVIPTIRSRTHHYPFRLVPPDVLVPYLAHVCEAEDVPVGAGVLPLVVRAGAGSVRDSLSVLDQLLAGAGPDGLEYEGAVALLGYTPAALLDDLVDAIAARDGATAFSVVERVIATGHEPRRFVEDLLERLRDLIVIAAAGDAASAALGALPADQLTRMSAQASHLGWAELSRSADLANAALTEMAGATSPRLQLELLMARLLLPAADDGAAGFGARLDRLERGWPTNSAAGGASAAVPGPAAATASVPAAAPAVGVVPPATASVPPAVPRPAETSEPAAVVTDVTPGTDEPPLAPQESQQSQQRRGSTAAPSEPAPSAAAPRVASPDSGVTTAAGPRAAAPGPDVTAPAAPTATSSAAPVPASAPSRLAGQDTEMLRRRWPEVLETTKGLRRATWILVGQNAQVQDLDATTLRLAFPTPGLVDRFRDHADVVARAVRETLGFDVHVQAVLAGAPTTSATPRVAPAADRPEGGSPASSGGARRGGRASAGGGGIPSVAEAAASWDAPAGSSSTSSAASTSSPASGGSPSAPVGAGAAAGSSSTFASASSAPAGTGEPAGSSPAPVAAPPGREPEPDDDLDDPPIDPPPDEPDDDLPADPADSDAGEPEEDEPSPDDPVIEGSNLVGAPLVARLLGGTVIDEQVDDPTS